ncbi:MAG: PTS sugar transporter subunit IIA [Candidatus Aminicenantes bacterium]|nr:PTS sugar transporter subunit IIA [Candidatus Aminicenantes bacterium]
MKESESQKHLTDFLKSSQVLFNIKSTDKVAAIEELLDVLVKQKMVQNKKLTLTRIIDREELESTALGHGLALPHARVDTGGTIAMAVGRSKEGIEFEAIDNKKVHLIFLVIWNPTLPGLFNHLFAGLARFVRVRVNRQRLLEAKNAAELYKVLSEVELTLPREDKIINRGNLLWKLQQIELKMKKASKDKKKKMREHAELIRSELDIDLLDRYDRLMDRYGFAVAEVMDGACQGCNINVATGMSSAIEGSNDIYVCENCGKFLVAAKKQKN